MDRLIDRWIDRDSLMDSRKMDRKIHRQVDMDKYRFIKIYRDRYRQIGIDRQK